MNALAYGSEVRREGMDGGLFYADGFLRWFVRRKNEERIADCVDGYG